MARLLLFVALRGLLASRLTFALLVIPIALGVGFQIPNTANLAGSSATLVEEALERGAGDIRVEPRARGRFADGDAVAARIRTLVGARAAVPVLAVAGAVGRGGRFHGVPVYGVDPVGAAPTSDFRPFRVVEGAPLRPGDRGGVLVGTRLARRLGVRPGDTVELRLIFSPPEAALVEDNLGRYTMTVRGIAAGSSGAYRFVYVDRAFLAAEAGEPGAASAIFVHLGDHDTAAALAARIDRELPEARALDWRTDDPFVPNVMRANRIVNDVSYAMVIGAISVPLWALLYIHVLRRRREIGILVALGFRRGEVFAIYVLQSLIAACAGIALGMLLGYAAAAYFMRHPVFDWEGMVVRPLLEPSTFAVPALVVLAATAAAGGYAAWRAARVDPARALQSLE